jgi:tripartite-type tricarboxylate transporter receptor subunit TctC
MFKKLFVAFITFINFNAFGQPANTIKIIVPYVPGGMPTSYAHLTAEIFNNNGLPTFVSNIGGADGVIGTNLAAKAPPDGKTLFVGAGSVLASNVVFNATGREYDQKSFTPIVLYNQVGLVLAVPAESPIKNYEQFKFYVRANPEKFNVGIYNSNVGKFFLEWANKENLPRPEFIAFKGSLPNVTALAGNQEPFAIDVFSTPILPLVQAGKIRIIATFDEVSAEEFKKLMTGAPITNVAKIHPELETGVWWGLFAPAGTDPKLINQYNNIINQAVRNNEYQTKFSVLDLRKIGGKPERINILLNRDIQTFTRVKNLE